VSGGAQRTEPSEALSVCADKAGAPAIRPLSGDVLSEPTLEIVARTLYETMERLDAGTNEYVEWHNLPDRDREFYALTIRRLLLRKREILELLSDHDMIAGHVKEGEKPDCN
jgi:hypothetical protein